MPKIQLNWHQATEWIIWHIKYHNREDLSFIRTSLYNARKHWAGLPKMCRNHRQIPEMFCKASVPCKLLKWSYYFISALAITIPLHKSEERDESIVGINNGALCLSVVVSTGRVKLTCGMVMTEVTPDPLLYNGQVTLPWVRVKPSWHNRHVIALEHQTPKMHSRGGAIHSISKDSPLSLPWNIQLKDCTHKTSNHQSWGCWIVLLAQHNSVNL